MHLKLFSVLAALALTGVLVYYSGGYDSSLLDSLLPGQTAERSVPSLAPKPAPKKYAKKQPPVSVSEEEFSFFDTLADPALKKYVGLDGKIKGRRLLPKKPGPANVQKPNGNQPLPSAVAPDDAANHVMIVPPPSTIATKAFSKARALPKTKPSLKTKASLTTAGIAKDNAAFVVEADSFRKFDQAIGLVKKLQIQGYPAYLSTFEPAKSGGVRYQVFLGRYTNRGKALQVAQKARTKEGLTLKVVVDRE